MLSLSNMKKIFFLFLILSTSLILSACTLKDQVKSKILNKIDTKVQQEKSELTDEQLLKELNINDNSIDTELKTLETELQ